MSDDDTGPNYDYDANKPAALLFTVIFGIALLLHIGQAIRYRTWWVWPLIIGLILETEGFAFRWYSIVKFYTLWPLVVSQVSVIVAPAFIAAQNYMLVGRMMSYLGKEHSIVSHTLITKIFVLCDIVSILTQAVSASMLNGDDLTTVRTGFDILIAALAFQVFMFLIFVGITIVFDKRSRAAHGEARKAINPLFVAFYLSAGMIILRSVYRTLEFATVKFGENQPATGYSLTHEWLVYVWDALPITISAFTLNVIHAGRYLPSKKGQRLDGTVEEPQPSRVCGCCCIYKRPRPVKYDANGVSMYQPGYMGKGTPLTPQESA
ncbi:hypothetical protein EXIGLDRAFT_648310 [Exidia glandulosa HHB12029]|uniref:RTA1-domain-containing protein n=1 Tax=Exidia glandulosa HHB12029 TaxID=1314781 RepID=A0A165H1S9_EXIGL|nr:hypothetical protein EXIGLDRAFT_648310 [Exidia glandulosa HHB12029]